MLRLVPAPLRRAVRRSVPPSLLIRLLAPYYRRFGERELRLVAQLSSPRKLSIDVGANRGIYTYFMRRHARECIAFEPNPSLADLLRRTFGRGVRVEGVALSDRAGTARLVVPLQGGKEADTSASIAKRPADFEGSVEGFRGAREVDVPMSPLDDFGLRDVGFIKIDVEGHELAVLHGARGLLARDHPNLLIEIEERHRAGAVASVTAFLETFGYAGYFVSGDRAEPIRRFDPGLHQDHVAQLAATGGRGAYINNFIYLHSADSSLPAQVFRGLELGRG